MTSCKLHFPWTIKICFTAILGLLLTSESTYAASLIGINFYNSGRANGDLLAGDNAGIVPQMNWNNGAGADGAIVGAVDDSGAATSLNVTWDSDEAWSVTTSAPATDDGRLVNGFLSSNTNTTGSASTISLSNIPFSDYDLYIYTNHDRANEDVRISETLEGLLTDFFAIEDVTSTTLGDNPFVFNEIAASGGTGNYIHLAGLTASALNFSFNADGTNGGTSDRGAIGGLQIIENVQIPEPASIAIWTLLGFALSAFGYYRARRNK